VHQTEIKLASKKIFPGESFSPVVPLGEVVRSVQAGVLGGALTLPQAVAEAALGIDLDHDGIPDPRDGELDLGGREGTGIDVSPNGTQSWSAGVEGLLEARLTPPVANQPLRFFVGGVELEPAPVTDESGLATVPFTPQGAGVHLLEVEFPGSEDLAPSNAGVELRVAPAAHRVEILSPSTPWIRPGPVVIDARVTGPGPVEVELRIDGEVPAGFAGFPFTWDASGEAPGSTVLIEIVAGEARASRMFGVAGALFERGNVRVGGKNSAEDDVNMADAVRILGYLFLGAPESLPCLDAADVNDSGIVDITDAIYLLGYLFLGTAEPPAPFGFCGYDPPGDDLECGDETSFSFCPDGD
jgi:hypothetical protein